MQPKEIARQLRGRMEAERWTQVAISKATGVHQSQISRFRAGKFARSSNNLQRVCEYAGICLDRTVARDGDQDLRESFDQLIAGLDSSKRSALYALLQNLLVLT